MPVGDCDRRLVQHLGVLSNWQALARQRRFIHRQIPAFENSGIGGHELARREDEDIAGHDRRGEHLKAIAVTLDLRHMLRRPRQAADKALRGIFRREADGGVGEYDADRQSGVQQATGGEGKNRRSEQQRHRQARELRRDHIPLRAAERRRSPVRPVDGEPAARLVRRKTVRPATQQLEDILAPRTENGVTLQWRFVQKPRSPRTGAGKPVIWLGGRLDRRRFLQPGDDGGNGHRGIMFDKHAAQEGIALPYTATASHQSASETP